MSATDEADLQEALHAVRGSSRPWALLFFLSLALGLGGLYWQRQQLEASAGAMSSLDARGTRLLGDAQALRDQKKELEQRITQLETEKSELLQFREQATKTEQGKEARQAALSALKDKLAESVKAELTGGEASVAEADGTVRVAISGAALFEGEPVVLSKRGMETLGRLARVLASAEGVEVGLEGHAERLSVPADKSKAAPDPWDQSARLSALAVRYLQDRTKLPAKRLHPRFYGSLRPSATNPAAATRLEVEVRWAESNP